MTQVIELREYEDWVDHEGVLEDQDARFIRSELSGRITLRRDPFGGPYILNPNQYAGVVILPSGLRIQSHPKVPVGNLFYMIAVASDLPPPFREQMAQYDRLEMVLEFIAAYFADRVEDRIKQGLHRSYVEREENLSLVRGRIDFTRDTRLNAILRHRKYCRFAEFTWDIPENQILHQVLHLLAGAQFSRATRVRLGQLEDALAELTPAMFPAGAVDRFHYHRFNDDYRQLHQLCRLFLEGASLSEELGVVDFRTFLVDMNALFEKFIAQVLTDAKPSGILVEPQVHTHLDWARKVLMRPDIVVRRSGSVRLVADTKYKLVEPEEFQHHDVYQILAYCSALRVARGLLIYPLHALETEDAVHVKNLEVEIRRITVDLSGGILALRAVCSDLAEEVFGWAGVRRTEEQKMVPV
jgi:5-methylcytosine-specific restriction enzyme subunit McrC